MTTPADHDPLVATRFTIEDISGFDPTDLPYLEQDILAIEPNPKRTSFDHYKLVAFRKAAHMLRLQQNHTRSTRASLQNISNDLDHQLGLNLPFQPYVSLKALLFIRSLALVFTIFTIFSFFFLVYKTRFYPSLIMSILTLFCAFIHIHANGILFYMHGIWFLPFTFSSYKKKI